MSSLIAPAINLAILLGFLVYKLRAPIRQFVAQRHLSLREELQRVRALLYDAQAKHEEFSSKLKAVDVEIAELRTRARQDAQAAQQRIVAEAQRLSAQIISDARATADSLFSEARGSLYREMADRVLDRSERIMRERLTGDDRIRIRQEFSRQMETAQ